jgi:hypothetical protein
MGNGMGKLPAYNQRIGNGSKTSIGTGKVIRLLLTTLIDLLIIICIEFIYYCFILGVTSAPFPLWIACAGAVSFVTLVLLAAVSGGKLFNDNDWADPRFRQ